MLSLETKQKCSARHFALLSDHLILAGILGKTPEYIPDMPDTPKYPRQPYTEQQLDKAVRQTGNHTEKRYFCFFFFLPPQNHLWQHMTRARPIPSHPMATIIILRQGRKNWVIAPGFQNIVYGALVAKICIFIPEAKKAQKEELLWSRVFGVSG